jgi:pSer/pThr/pTyr-binding forkhead associated (FHA) protein
MRAKTDNSPNGQAGAEGKTGRISSQESPSAKARPVGEALIQEQTLIVFEIDGIPLKLPVQDTVIVGRLSDIPTDPAPHLNLDAFDAKDLGISRRHLKITRARDLIYVLDMDSSNGTYLNGRRLASRCPRILRNGDDLLLGRLRVRVRFQ